ncbi:hypothetical protein AMECASPLE_003886 [Ameca splendens]|uniref:Uncharacterized protein n=1 Tax=Ameca splendens TaxID=208324 RepID=A0ABV0YKS0_9TELE
MQEHKQMQQPSKTRHDNAGRRPLKARRSPRRVGPPTANEPKCGGTQTGRSNASTIMQSVRACKSYACMCLYEHATLSPSHSSLTAISDCCHLFFLSVGMQANQWGHFTS